MRDITNQLRRKLDRLEPKVAARVFNGDVMASIERDTARLEHYHREGRWSADMSVKECERLETDLETIGGNSHAEST